LREARRQVAAGNEGSARVEFEGGSVMECGPGARIEGPAGVLHRETGGGGRVVFGFDRPLTDFTQPVNKPATERALVES
jgi:hypothetical protein